MNQEHPDVLIVQTLMELVEVLQGIRLELAKMNEVNIIDIEMQHEFEPDGYRGDGRR